MCFRQTRFTHSFSREMKPIMTIMRRPDDAMLRLRKISCSTWASIVRSFCNTWNSSVPTRANSNTKEISTLRYDAYFKRGAANRHHRTICSDQCVKQGKLCPHNRRPNTCVDCGAAVNVEALTALLTSVAEVFVRECHDWMNRSCGLTMSS